MKQRVITGILMGVILIPILILGGWFVTGLVTILAYIACFELISMYLTKNNIPTICKYVIPLFSSLIVIGSGIGNLTDVVYILLVELMCLLVLPIFNKQIKSKDIIFFIFAIIYSGVSFTLVNEIRNLNVLLNSSIEYKLFEVLDIHLVGLIMCCYVLIITMFTDIFAYQFGIKFGKRKLCPTISPKKSVEGAIAGTIFGAFGGTILMVVLQLVLKETDAKALLLFNINKCYLY